MISPGARWYRVDFQNYRETRSASGHASRSWVTYAADIWCSLRTLSGNERLAARQVSGVLTHELTTRYTTDFTPRVDHRIVWGSRYFDIKDIRNVDETNVQWRMLVTEVMTAGPSSSGSPSASPSASASSSASA